MHSVPCVCKHKFSSYTLSLALGSLSLSISQTTHTLTHAHTYTHITRQCTLTRVEGECIDYSTQYPWSFGVLSVLMATGLHPLKDYPESYESGNKVKYRSHDYQALPDAEQVRRSETFQNCCMYMCK